MWPTIVRKHAMQSQENIRSSTVRIYSSANHFKRMWHSYHTMMTHVPRTYLVGFFRIPSNLHRQTKKREEGNATFKKSGEVVSKLVEQYFFNDAKQANNFKQQTGISGSKQEESCLLLIHDGL